MGTQTDDVATNFFTKVEEKRMGSWQEGKKDRRKILETSEIHPSEAASEKTANTYLSWGQF